MQANAEKEEYTRWLISYIGGHRHRYSFLFNTLNNIEFYWSMEDDKNRMIDARDLRNEYCDNYGDDVLNYLPAAVTVLEVLVALSTRADMIIGLGAYTWLLIFLENLGLDFLTDNNWSQDSPIYISSVIRKWLDRRFSPNGSGSPFRSSIYNLTQTTIWNSMQWYVKDNFGEDHI
jgi:hypothetical protein